jgi:hypothetical protein
MTSSSQPAAPEPSHSLSALTTSELTRYRRELERAIGDKTIGQAPIVSDLKAKLQLVIDEEVSREQHRHCGKRWPLHN